MKKIFALITSLFIALPLFAQSESTHFFKKEYSNLKNVERKKLSDPTLNSPAIIFRMKGNLGPNDNFKDCNAFYDKFDKDFIRPLTYYGEFYYALGVGCITNENLIPRSFEFYGYIDAIDNEASVLLEKYLAEHNGQKIYGTTFNGEKAKSVVIKFRMEAAYTVAGSKSPLYPTLKIFFDDTSYHHAASAHQILSDFFEDVKAGKLYSHDPNIILPFMTKWLSKNAEAYSAALKKADNMVIWATPMFLIEDESKLYSLDFTESGIGTDCSGSESGYCL